MDADFRTEDEGLLRRYLLGGLPEAQREPLEEKLFAEEGFLEHLALVEDELIDSYVRDELPAEERERFESHFLVSLRHLERVEFAQSWRLSGNLQVISPPAPVPVRPMKTSQWRRFVEGFSAGMRAPAFAAAAAAVLVTGAVMIPFYSGLKRQANESREQAHQIDALRAEIARKPAVTPQLPDTSGGRAASALLAPLSLMLNPGALRSADQPEQRLAIPSGERSVQLHLRIKSAPAYPRYHVEIQVDGREVWGKELAKSGTPPQLTLDVPTSVLKPGDYNIEVSGVTGSGELEQLPDYFVFSVSSR